MIKYKARYNDRISAIKKVKVEDKIKCDRCRRIFSKGYSFQILRWSSGKSTKLYNYCTFCANTPEDVLSIVDSDEIMFGIAYVDDFFDYTKRIEDENKAFVYNLFKGFLHK